MGYNGKCCICGEKASAQKYIIDTVTLFECEACGKFLISTDNDSINKNFLASFLYYNCKIPSQTTDKKCLYFLGSKEESEEIQKKEPYTSLVAVTSQEVENWYPRTFNGKIDKILLGFSELSKYYGSSIKTTYEQYCSAFFVKRYNSDNSETTESERISQITVIENYLSENNFIKGGIRTLTSEKIPIKLSPDGLKKIDELQKNQSSNSKNVFVAMSFDNDMKEVKEAIFKAILVAGYSPIIMNEVQHNKPIVPEMLYKIKQSKFVVAEFTKHNKGVYYEAGYAAGLGKKVIHICKKKSFGKGIHFDLKQINTIIWETEAELTEKLSKRIEAIIE
jgi:nucleoside 2-deoxyribosyltransferase